MTSEECFEAAVQVENLMRDVYVRLADRYAVESRLRETFLRLAAEEEQHAHRIRLLAKCQGQGTWAEDTARRISKDLHEMSGDLLDMVKDLEEDWEGGAARNVLHRVMQAEERCSAIHAEVLARTAEIDVQMLFWSLARQDVHHKQLLETATSAAA